jgi:hypothetical protein
MPVEIFVSTRVDLATLGRVRVALDLGLLSTQVFFCSLFVCENWRVESFTPTYACDLAELSS